MTTNTTPVLDGKIVWRVPYWAWAPLGLAIIAEASVNALRAYTIGQQHANATVDLTIYGTTFTVSVFGTVLVFAAIALALSQARAAWVAFKPGALARQRAIAGPIAGLLLVVSVTALALTLLEAQRSKSGDEGGQRTAYDIAKADFIRAATELEALGTPRPVSVIQAEVRSHPIDMRIWRRSNECEDISLEATRTACEPILALYKERGAAARKSELELTLPGLKAKLDALPRPAEPSWIEGHATSGWAWAFGLAAVLIATFGAPLFAEPITRESKLPEQPRGDILGQSDYPAFADHPALLKNAPDGPERPAGGTKTPNRPKGPKPDGRTEGLKDEVLAYIQRELATGRSVPSNIALVGLFGGKRSTISDWLSEWERSGVIPARRTVGRCKVIVGG